MSLTTTCIGAYPKPGYVKLPDWFNLPSGPDTSDPTRLWLEAMEAMGSEAPAIIERGIREAIADQVECGIDIPTDGEIVRENYIHYHCRHLNGIDFQHLTEKAVRGGNYSADLPSIVSPVSVKEPYIADDWRRAQSMTDRPVKITLPGPMTVGDTTADLFYNDPVKRGAALAEALNAEILALADAGCRYIQIDEPVFARQPGPALAFGFENLEKAFHGCPRQVMRTVHMCCGYPDRLDHPGYPKADLDAYNRIADAVEESSIDAVSLEFAHRPGDLALLEHFKTTRVIFGAVAIAKSRVESVEEIREHLGRALEHIDAGRLLVAPDCGLGLLDRECAMHKLRNMSEAARSL